MLSIVFQVLISVIIVSLISIIVTLPIFFKKNISQKTLFILLSLSVGTLLGGVFIHFLPETAANGFTTNIALKIILGFLTFFILEKFIHWHHNHKTIGECNHPHAHHHAYHLAPLNLIGDGIHNFLDGMIIAGSYIISFPLGLAATISIVFHEIPQEIADFGVLLYSGMSRKKAIFFNFLSALTAIVGAVIGLLIAGRIEGFTTFIIPFAAGSFIYIATANLVPQLHRHCKIKDSILHLLAIIAGIALMIGLLKLGG